MPFARYSHLSIFSLARESSECSSACCSRLEPSGCSGQTFASEHRATEPLSGSRHIVLGQSDVSNHMNHPGFRGLRRARKIDVHHSTAAAATVFRKHCETLISVIRRSRIDRQDVEDLHNQAVKAHKELTGLSAKDEGQALRTLIRMPNSSIWSPDIPLAPAHLRAHAELQTITFAVESVGQDFAIVLLDKGSRRVLSADRARTRMSWKPLEQPRNTSTWLHRKMLRNADVKAECSCILNKNGQLHGIALHSIAKDI